jgi:hypothetical protein
MHASMNVARWRCSGRPPREHVCVQLAFAFRAIDLITDDSPTRPPIEYSHTYTHNIMRSTKGAAKWGVSGLSRCGKRQALRRHPTFEWRPCWECRLHNHPWDETGDGCHHARLNAGRVDSTQPHLRFSAFSGCECASLVPNVLCARWLRVRVFPVCSGSD